MQGHIYIYANGLMTVTCCAASGHIVWAMLLMGEGLGMDQASQNVGKYDVWVLRDGQKPHDLLRHGL